jgi:hypothetical protein
MFAHMRWFMLAGSAIVLLSLESNARGQEQSNTVVPYIERHAVFRPAFNIPTRRPQMDVGYEFPTKPIFLKGYAGYNYGKGPREAYIPTGCGAGTIAPVGVGDPQGPGPAFLRPWWRTWR